MTIANTRIEERLPTVEEYQTLRNTTDWSVVSDEAVEDGLKRSLYAVCVFYDAMIVGTGRVVGDGGLYFYIQDMIVKPDYQGNGIGKSILDKLMYYITSRARNNAFVGLMAAKGAVGFYQKIGFNVRPENRPGMFIEVKK